MFALLQRVLVEVEVAVLSCDFEVAEMGDGLRKIARLFVQNFVHGA